jgi:hypothetical protein
MVQPVLFMTGRGLLLHQPRFVHMSSPATAIVSLSCQHMMLLPATQGMCYVTWSSLAVRTAHRPNSTQRYALYCTAQHTATICTVLYSAAHSNYCTVQRSTQQLLHCTVQRSTQHTATIALYCTARHRGSAFCSHLYHSHYLLNYILFR